jgi:hypothetical protein
VTLFLIVVVIVAAALVLGLIARGQSTADAGGSVGMPYTAAPALFSPAERSFLGVLDQALARTEYWVFGKVRVGDVANLKPGLSKVARQGALNRISGKHLDFVVCRGSDLGILTAIELNDKSHGSQRAKQRDEFLVRLCQTIGLPLIQVPAKASYSIEQIQNQVMAALPGQATPVSSKSARGGE